jgi:hypothetical protein
MSTTVLSVQLYAVREQLTTDLDGTLAGPAGQGDVPLLESLAAAPSTEYAVIEFDHYEGDMFEGIQASVSYLNEQGVM